MSPDAMQQGQAQAEVQAVQEALQAAQAARNARIEAELARARAAVDAAVQDGPRGTATVVVPGPGGPIVGVPTTAFPSGPFGPRERQIPDGLVPLIGIIFGFVMLTIVLFPLSRAFARRMDRKSSAVPTADPHMATRLDRIEQAIEAMAVEVERVSEAQRYSARLLTERLPEAPARALASDHAR